MKKSSFLLLIFCGFSFISCASKPKRTMLINTVSTSSNTMIENATSSMASGDYVNAEQFIEKAYKMAMSVDNYDLLVSVNLAKVSIYLSEVPSKIEDAKAALREAEEFAESSTNVPKSKALCALSSVRIELTSDSPNYNGLISTLDNHKVAVAKDLFEAAQFDSVKGDVLRLQKKYDEAEKSYLSALDVFTKECYLSELGVNWYKVAQVRSLKGNKSSALEALENAIKYDRNSENSHALGADYYAKGVILMKDNPTQSEKNQAEYAFKHSADIYNAADLSELAQRSLDKWESYK